MKFVNYEEHMNLFFESCIEWRQQNYKSPAVRKSLKYIANQKKRRGII